MLTARGANSDEARGRACGADDYLTKPFATQELVSRVRVLLGEAPA
jgi:DNA-binding response OmpR family regulator